MSDPLSIAGSVAGLVVLVEAVVNSIYEFSKNVAGAKDDINELLSGITAIYGVLKSVELVTGKLKLAQASDAATPLIITQCSKAIIRVREKLRGASIEPKSQSTDTRKRDGAHAAFTGLKKRLMWPFKKKEIQDLLKELETQKSTLSMALSADALSGAINVFSQQEATHRVVDAIRNDQLAKFKRRLNREERDILKLFLVVNPTERYEEQLHLHHRGTGTWLLKCPEYKNFVNNPGGKLWLYGIPGAGKTVLTAVANQDVCRRRTESQASAFFLCTYKDEKTQDLRNILSSLAAQLASQSQEALEKLLQFHREHSSAAPSGASRLSKLVVDLASFFDSTTIIVDGLDECQHTNWRTITSALVGLSNNTARQASIKLLLTSRKEHNIKNELDDFAKLSIAARSTNFQLFVAEQLAIRAANKTLRIKSPDLKTLILDKLVEGAQGMWQWAKCQLDTLCNLKNDAARRRALDNLPRTLHGTYERILERANTEDPKNQKLLARCLMWIGVNNQFTALQLAEAISIEENSSSIDPEAIPDINDVMSLCGSLVVKTTMDTIEFSHFSVREFLKQIRPCDPYFSMYRLDIKAEELKAAKLLLTYLLYADYDKPLPNKEEKTKEAIGSHPLLFFAAEHWHHYARPFLESDSRLQELTYNLMNPGKSNNLLNWAFFHIISRTRSVHREVNYEELKRICQESTSLHWACHLNISPTIQQLLEAGLDPTKRSLWFDDKVRFEVWFGNRRLYRSPLECCVLSPYRGTHDSSISLQSILEKNVSKDPDTHDPIPLAIWVWDVATLYLLVKYGFPITHRAIEALDETKSYDPFRRAAWNEIQEVNSTPELELAFRQRVHPEMYETIPLRGKMQTSVSNSQAHIGSIRSILLAAIYGRRAELKSYAHCFEGLLRDDINALSNALLVTAECSHVDLVEYLMLNGANPLAKNADGLTILHILAELKNLDGCLMVLRLRERINGVSSLLSIRDNRG